MFNRTNDKVAVPLGTCNGARLDLNYTFARPLLPNEPRILLEREQAALTETYLSPVMVELEVFFLAVRTQIDEALHQLQPTKLGKPYPVGQCLEITLAVEKQLRQIELPSLSGTAASGYMAFRRFLSAGGAFRQVWGDLRGEFFQNAFQLGTLYVDVSNDTVVPAKPKIEILPFRQSRLGPINDFYHFGRIAQSYWKDRIYPNHVLPELAPYCPLVHVSVQGVVQLRDATNYMVALATTRRFEPSEEVLSAVAMPTEVFAYVSRVLHGTKLRVATSPQAGRIQALRNCRDYRAKRWHQSPSQTAKIITSAQQVNVRLVKSHNSIREQSVPSLNTTNTKDILPMAMITIDNINYDLDSLSVEAKAQLQSIQFVDQELARLQGQIAAMQTARNAYANALKAVLPIAVAAG